MPMLRQWIDQWVRTGAAKDYVTEDLGLDRRVVIAKAERKVKMFSRDIVDRIHRSAPDGLMTFYEGAMQASQSVVRHFVESLKKISPTPLPVTYISALGECDGQPLAAGTLDDLYWLVNWKTGEVRAET